MTAAMPSQAVTPRRQLLVTTGVVSAGVATLIAGMLSMWLKFRASAATRASSDGLKVIKDWLPANVKVPEVAANTMLFAFVLICVMAQWAVYAAKRRDGQHRSLALGICFAIGIAIINAQVAVYAQMKIGVADGAYQAMFYAITGTMILLVAAGMAFSFVAFFRSIGGRAADSQVVSAHALYWYVLSAAFAAMWFVVYVQK
jgi:heme/copper-type cytochrome/quinol oxidase subunit 3